MSDKYYTVKIDVQRLMRCGYDRNNFGRYERIAESCDRTFERVDTCPMCGRRVTGYRKMITSKGTLMVRALCEGAPDSGHVCAKQTEAGKAFAKEIRL